MFRLVLLLLVAPALAQPPTSCAEIPPEALDGFCGQACPCCSAAAVASQQLAVKGPSAAAFPFEMLAKKSAAKAVAEKRKVRDVATILKFREAGVKSARMLDRWKKDGPLANIVKPTAKKQKLAVKADGVKPVGLYDVSDDDFHKELMGDIAKSHSLQEFMAEKYPEVDWNYCEAIRAQTGWTISELAIHLYTAEEPNIYNPMNAMMRNAQSIDDIDEYWQSYMAILKKGLEEHAPFINTDTWRGVGDCSSLDVLHVGDEGVLPSFTSTSTNRQAAAVFARGCTMLHFTGGGYDVSAYSNFPGEAELIMEEGRVYTIESAEQKCEVDGYGQVMCFERFDCETDGPADGVTGPTADAASMPNDQTEVCAALAEAVDLQSYCPLCSCCGPPPAPVAAPVGNSCCDCCTDGGACLGSTCEGGGGLYMCNEVLTRHLDMLGCAADAMLMQTQMMAQVQGSPAMLFAAAGCMMVGFVIWVGIILSVRRASTRKVVPDAENAAASSGYTPLIE